VNQNFADEIKKIFKKGSKTYFYSSLFFPKKIRDKVDILYAFVRTADDFVDCVPADRTSFFQFKNYYLEQKKLTNSQKNKTKISSDNQNLAKTNFEINLENSFESSLEDFETKLEKNLKIDLKGKTDLKLEILEKESLQNKSLEIAKEKRNCSYKINENCSGGHSENYLNFQNTNNSKDSPAEKSEIPNLQTIEIKPICRQIIEEFIRLEETLESDSSWTLAFLASMESDLETKIYQNLEETKKYIYGSANVIGLFMSKILNLPAESYYFAEHLGMSFQYINFIRDIEEDLRLGRSYFPQDLLQKHNLPNLKLEEVKKKPKEFHKFVQEVLEQYTGWQEIAELGFHFFPKKYRTAIKTASDMYKWTGRQIAKNPFIVYEKKIKPQKRQILLTGIKNWLN
jgi:phytoene/squalene synthetase